MCSFYFIFCWAAALMAVIFGAQPADAYYTGACVKQPITTSPKGTHYHMRLPRGQKYSQPNEAFPGQTFYDELKSCHPHDFTTIYDIDGNAHVDFTIRKWKSRLVKNKCNVEERIAYAMHNKHTPVCVVGNGQVLADQWRESWKDEKE